MRVKFEPATADRLVWKVSVPDADRDVPVDFMTAAPEQRSFLGNGGYFDASPEAEGWNIAAPSPLA